MSGIESARARPARAREQVGPPLCVSGRHSQERDGGPARRKSQAHDRGNGRRRVHVPTTRATSHAIRTHNAPAAAPRGGQGAAPAREWVGRRDEWLPKCLFPSFFRVFYPCTGTSSLLLVSIWGGTLFVGPTLAAHLPGYLGSTAIGRHRFGARACRASASWRRPAGHARG